MKSQNKMLHLFYTGNITIANKGRYGRILLQKDGDSDYYQRCRKYTEIGDVLAKLSSHKPFLLLLEGGPGMGKTTVCREIANQWGNGKIESYDMVFLICLHLPNAKKIVSFELLFEAVCPGNQTRLSMDMLDHLSHTRGENVLVIIDGFNELDKTCSSFLLDIIHRNLLQLQLCDMVISSCSSEAGQLHHCVNCTRVEILGFTDDAKHQYFKQHVANDAEKLQECIESKSFIKLLCYHPLFLTNLVNSFKASQLPSCETEITDRLICQMIIWCLKVKPSCHNLSISRLFQELPSEHQLLIHEVSKCAYLALQSERTLFTFEELNESFQGNFKMNGLGFLKSFIATESGEHFSFIHHSLQEFLISFYITTLSDNKRERFRKDNMWRSKYLNIWFHYCGLVKGDDNIITASLSDSWFGSLFGVKGTSEVLQDKMKCLYLLHCYLQSPDNSLYQQVKTKVIVDENILDISHINLTTEGLQLISLFLSRYSHKKWKCLNFSKCCIDNKLLTCILSLLQDLLQSTLSISVLDFTENNVDLNKHVFLNIINAPNIQQLILSHNKIRDEDVSSVILSITEKQFHKHTDIYLRSIQNHNTLFIFYTASLKNQGIYSITPLVELYLIRCHFTSEAVDDLCNALKLHYTLSLLCLYDNKLLSTDVVKIADSLNVSIKVTVSFLLYEISLSDKDADHLYQTLATACCSSQLMLVSTSKLQALRVTSYHIILALKYINSVDHIQLRQCYITHEVMLKIDILLSNSSTSCNMLDLCGNRVDDSHLEIFSNSLDFEVSVKSLSFSESISSLKLAELICCVHPSYVKISGSLTDGNNQSVGMVVAENLFTSQRQSIVMLTCDNEKVGIFHKLDLYSSCIVENTSQLTQLFINNCTIDGEVLANSLDNSESVVLLHLSNMEWDGEVFYTCKSFIKNKRIMISVVENILPKIVQQNLLSTFDANGSLSRIVSTDNIFIAHSCSHELVRWHLTQEVLCKPLELFYVCNCPMTTDPEWYNVVEHYFNSKPLIYEIILHNNRSISKRLEKLLENTIQYTKVKDFFISECVLNCNWLVSLLSSVPSVTIASSKMVISVGGTGRQFAWVVNEILPSLQVIRMINSKCTTDSYEILVKALSKCTKLQEFTVSGGSIGNLHSSAILIRAISHLQTLKCLQLHNNTLTSEAVKELMIVIANNSSLETLTLNNLGLTAADVILICPLIGKLTNLKIFSLTDNIISEKAAHSLAAAISNKSSLCVLCLGKTKLQSTGTIAIANALTTVRTLKMLMLSDNLITNAASRNIAAAISSNASLENLYLDNTFLGTDGVINMANVLCNSGRLKVLRLNNNKLDHKAANHIQEIINCNPYLESIRLDNNLLYTANMLKMGHGLSHIKVLGISCNGITEQGAGHLADMVTSNSELEKLQISNNFLTAKGCNIITDTLKSISTLKRLYLGNNNLTKHGADGMAAVITSNPLLEVLDVEENELLTAGTIKIANALQKIRNLKELWLSNNYITEKAANHIAAVITSNTKLEKLQLDNNLLKTSGICSICNALKKNYSLKAILFGNNDINQDAAECIAEVIHNNPFIECVKLGSNNLQNCGTTHIANALKCLYHLKALSLENNNIGFEAADDIAAVIASNTDLEILWLQDNELGSKGTQAICNALEKVNALKGLAMDNNKITEDAIDEIGNQMISKKCSLLETLSINESNLSTASIIKVSSIFRQLHWLKTVKFNLHRGSDEATDNIAVVISCSTELERLNLRNVLQFERLAVAMKHINTLRFLHLENNSITGTSTASVAAAISSNPLLECVYLGHNKLRLEGVCKLIVAFQRLQYLCELGLNNNELNEEAAAYIAAIISGKLTLKKFWINNNKLKSPGIKKLCNSLKLFSGLTLLNFENNEIDESAATDIADVVVNNKLLQVSLFRK